MYVVDPWTARDGFRLGAPRPAAVDLLVDDRRETVEAVASLATAQRIRNGAIAVMSNGETFVVHLYDPFAAADAAGTPSDRVVDSPPDSLEAGDMVHVAGEPSPDKQADLARPE